MSWKLKDLIRHAQQCVTDSREGWVPVRPVPGPFIWRVKAAWAVLTGRADAFTWPAGQ